MRDAISDGTPTAEIEILINRAATSWLNFIHPLGIAMSVDAASDWAVVTAVLCRAYPGPFPDLPTARSMLRGAGVDADVAALHDYARLMAAVAERLAI